jgi:predicted RNA-binding Zn-ribbon protein involved in translation (DUF1610 family)
MGSESPVEREMYFRCANPACGKIFSRPLSSFMGNENYECSSCGGNEFAIDFERLPDLDSLIRNLRTH